jgi:hypothetical protein
VRPDSTGPQIQHGLPGPGGGLAELVDDQLIAHWQEVAEHGVISQPDFEG